MAAGVTCGEANGRVAPLAARDEAPEERAALALLVSVGARKMCT